MAIWILASAILLGAALWWGLSPEMIGAAGLVIADPKLVYPAIADAAYAQIFSNILERENSTLDNDTRELAALEENGFTKSYGSFGVAAMVLPAMSTAMRTGLPSLSRQRCTGMLYQSFSG